MIRSVVCPTSVGREAPLRSLLERLDRAVEGQGTVLLLGGDAGVGKSRLVRDLKQEATTRHIRVIEGRCSSTESSVPYAPFMDALRFRIARGEGEEVAKILGPLRAILAPIFPQLEGAAAPVDQAADRDRERPYALIFGVLERLASDDPMLLVLEDIHWADQTSLELLHHLAHRATSLRLMMVVTYRSDELHAAHPLRRLLGSLAPASAKTCGSRPSDAMRPPKCSDACSGPSPIPRLPRRFGEERKGIRFSSKSWYQCSQKAECSSQQPMLLPHSRVRGCRQQL